MAYAELLTLDYESATFRSVEHWRWAEKFGALAILFAHLRIGEWVGLLNTSQPSPCSPYFAYVNARRAAREGFWAVPSLRGENASLRYQMPDGTLLCVCGHGLRFHVADRLPCLMEDLVEPECTCRAFREQVPYPPPLPPGQTIPPRACPMCNCPNFEQPSFQELGTYSIFLIRCTECRWMRTLADDEEAAKWKS